MVKASVKTECVGWLATSMPKAAGAFFCQWRQPLSPCIFQQEVSSLCTCAGCVAERPTVMRAARAAQADPARQGTVAAC
jgi:hypothetical protein